MTYPLDDIFSTASTVKVLRILVASELDMSGRQIASLAGLNPQTTQNTLDRLNEVGLLSARKVGRAKLYRFQPGNALVEKLLTPLFSAEKSFAEKTGPSGQLEQGEMNQKESDKP